MLQHLLCLRTRDSDLISNEVAFSAKIQFPLKQCPRKTKIYVENINNQPFPVRSYLKLLLPTFSTKIISIFVKKSEPHFLNISCYEEEHESPKMNGVFIIQTTQKAQNSVLRVTA
jgi:hypothetical protein